MKITFRVCCGNDSQSNNRNSQSTNNNRSIGNKQETTSSSLDRQTNSLDDSQLNNNPMQSLFKKLLPHSSSPVDSSVSSSDQANQIPSTGQHNLQQFDSQSENNKNNALQNVLNSNNRQNTFILSTALPPVPVSTPYWWRPHLSKLPTLKHQSLVPSEIGSSSINNNLNNLNNLNQFTLNSINNQQQSGSKSGSDVWVVVTGGCVAVVVAFLIVGALFR